VNLTGKIFKILALALIITAFQQTSAPMAAALQEQSSADKNDSPVKPGYAVVTPTSVANAGLVVFETFGEHRGMETTQAGVLPATMTTHAILFVSTNGRLSHNLGVAIANPGATIAKITLSLRDSSGAMLATEAITVDPRNQTARYVTELFSNHPAVPHDLTGTLDITSDTPVAVVGLRFRGVNFSTLPVTNLSGPLPVPVISANVGGATAVILPQFATGGGWESEIVLANTGPVPITVRVDLFSQNGLPLTADLNGVSASSFTGITIPAGGVVVLATEHEHDDDN
jgi:hypothetical protein